MSEQDPLLPSYSTDESAEAQPRKYATWKERTADFLESRLLHKAVITLASCVLADLSYTFLNETCMPDEETQPLWLTVLSHISLAITTFFLVEIPITIWSFGPRFYTPGSRITHSSLHFFDAVVIITTFVFEVVLRGRERELASLLIILRLWRLVKLVQGIAVSAGEIEEENARLLEETRQELEGLMVALADTREDNKKLRARIRLLESEQA
ncbi:uncharacterized protein FIBRA_00434 [Fibroporia radiculosa]|uniref:Voltage-gated hydrogen channel 1 n=1 Tax=Fibroporia radiculosa TaxID=599839 RepID=J4HRL6_9APHY|nr:uncharacterized protein FIBRA_00434 [Fibroporia radiculosa]CCL98437.1 predicted protein [Fibroporia radiculosa]